MCIKPNERRQPAVHQGLFTIPLLHFLEGKTQPQQPLDIPEMFNHQSDAWWGTSGLHGMLDVLKYKLDEAKDGSVALLSFFKYFSYDD